MLTQDKLVVDDLGERKILSPLKLSTVYGDGVVNYMPDAAKVPYQISWPLVDTQSEALYFEQAGPREQIYFDPSETVAAVATCGGLCPGLNNVVRSLFMELYHRYGVRKILGIRFGYAGLDPDTGEAPVELTRPTMENIHKDGGSVLGCSRGGVEYSRMLDCVRSHGINLMFCIGGDGTQKGAKGLYDAAESEGYKLATVGIPKTIDNDIMYVTRTFGYNSAVEKAREVIECAHTEAKSCPNGVVVVKLMGRHAGFIAAGATIASQDVNFTLAPEQPFDLDGPGGLFALVRQRLEARQHAVIVVAEGAGQELLEGEDQKDASGNLLNKDIGPFLTRKLKDYFAAENFCANVRYIDPSYIVRSVPANSDDAVLCDQLARNAVHAGMAGKTGVMVGYWHGTFIHVPISTVVSEQKHMCIESDLWRAVLATTGQPVRIRN